MHRVEPGTPHIVQDKQVDGLCRGPEYRPVAILRRVSHLAHEFVNRSRVVPGGRDVLLARRRTWHTNSSIARGGLVGAGHSGSIRGVARISAGLSCVNRPCRSEPTSLISGNKSHGSARAHRVRTAWITARGDSNGGNPQAAKSSMPAPSNRESRAARACDHQAARAFRSCIRSRPSSVGTRDRAVGQNTRRMPNCIWRGFAPGIWRLL